MKHYSRKNNHKHWRRNEALAIAMASCVYAEFVYSNANDYFYDKEGKMPII
jgi:hypothetical protein